MLLSGLVKYKHRQSVFNIRMSAGIQIMNAVRPISTNVLLFLELYFFPDIIQIVITPN